MVQDEHMKLNSGLPWQRACKELLPANWTEI
jgi:hypothetical protein